MSSLLSWIKREILYIKESSLEIIKAFFLFILASSGLISAILLRYLGFNGSTITFFGIIIEFITLILGYLMLKSYLKTKEESESSKVKKRQLE